MLAEAAYYLRMSAGLAHYQLSPKNARPVDWLRRQLEERDRHFLSMARYALARKDHFYSRLFELAGCAYADLERSVHSDGLDRTLKNLLEAGVYVTSDELRGRCEMVRNGKHIPTQTGDWLNPNGRGLFQQSSSGSTGKPGSSQRSTEFSRYTEVYPLLLSQQSGLANRTRMMVVSILPSAWPLRSSVAQRRIGFPIERWFAYSIEGHQAAHYSAVTRWLVLQTRLLGGGIAAPEFLPPHDYSPVVEALSQARKSGRPGYIRVIASAGARIAALAIEKGIDISGTLFCTLGEPLTPAKRALMERTGSQVFTVYNANEFGPIGHGCLQMKESAVHLFQDSLWVVSRTLPGSEFPRLYFTNLNPHAPLLLINLEMTDSAILEKTSCDCPYARAGLNLQLRDIFSYGKVTGQGMTIHAGDMVRLLDSVLPQRFGGSPGDYQLAEVETAAQTQMVLRVSPRAGAIDPQELSRYFMEQTKSIFGGHLSARVWSFNGGFEVRREEPHATQNGKIHPVRLLRTEAVHERERDAS